MICMSWPSFRSSEAQLVPDHDPGTRNPVFSFNPVYYPLFCGNNIHISLFSITSNIDGLVKSLF